MVFASIREHAEHCDFFASTSRNKNVLCEVASNAKIWGARASEHSFKFCEQLKILKDHSSPLFSIDEKSTFLSKRGQVQNLLFPVFTMP